MTQLSERELLELEIDAAWEAFTDSDPRMSTEHIKELDPAFYNLLALSFARGYVAGARTFSKSILRTFRSLQNERS